MSVSNAEKSATRALSSASFHTLVATSRVWRAKWPRRM